MDENLPENRIWRLDIKNNIEKYMPLERTDLVNVKKRINTLTDICIDYVKGEPEEAVNSKIELEGFLKMCNWFEPKKFNNLLEELEKRRKTYLDNLNASYNFQN